MSRKFVCAAVATLVVCCVALADEMMVVITKVDGDKVTVKTSTFNAETKKNEFEGTGSFACFHHVHVDGVKYFRVIAESFGKGREVPDFRPRGAREVRQAAQSFIEMKTRVERTIEQRTAMLAGVSHDLRTILTRFKLELALIGDGPDVEAMKKDVDEMNGMLEGYLAFARGKAR